MRMRKMIKKFLILISCIGVIGIILLLGINAYVKGTVSDDILESEQLVDKKVDCILVLGCQVRGEDPSPMLHDRLQRSLEVYELGIADKLLMSGDHGQIDYNEVKAMKEFATDSGIDSENIFMDHAGFSTYESIYRAKEVFGVKKMVIVTQNYHLYRALYIAEQLGVEAYGVAADYHSYAGQTVRDVREVLARVKDFGTTIIKPEPTYLGEFIDIHGDGNVTND